MRVCPNPGHTCGSRVGLPSAVAGAETTLRAAEEAWAEGAAASADKVARMRVTSAISAGPFAVAGGEMTLRAAEEAWAEGAAALADKVALLRVTSAMSAGPFAAAGAEATLRAAEEAWAEGAAALAEKVALLRGLMRKHSGPADPAGELLALLTGGRLSHAMHQFLSANLGALPRAHWLPAGTPLSA